MVSRDTGPIYPDLLQQRDIQVKLLNQIKQLFVLGVSGIFEGRRGLDRMRRPWVLVGGDSIDIKASYSEVGVPKRTRDVTKIRFYFFTFQGYGATEWSIGLRSPLRPALWINRQRRHPFAEQRPIPQLG